MRGARSRCVGWLAGLVVAACATEARAEALHYCYVALNPLRPPGTSLQPRGLDEEGRVYCALFTPGSLPSIAVIDHGALHVLPQHGIVSAVSKGGVIGGSAIDDPVTMSERAAIFRNGQVELLPQQPGEIRGRVVAVNDAGTAVSLSFDDTSGTVLLYQHGRLTPIDPAGDGRVPDFVHINDRGQISGTSLDLGFRYDTHTEVTTLLPPLSTEPDSWAMGINDRGDVVGFSFAFGGVERIGVWDQRGVFDELFAEGPPLDTVVANRLLVNNQGLIVVTRTTLQSTRHSYVIPERGVRVDLADVVEGAPQGSAVLWNIVGLNDHGDMAGFGFFGNAFLLERKQGPCDVQ